MKTKIPCRAVRAGLLTWLVAALMIAKAMAASPAQNSSSVLDTYKIQPLDMLRVQIFQEPDLDREVRVSKEHTLVLPLIGRIDLKGKTVREAEFFITDLYRNDFLVNPQINITVTEYAPRLLNVLGAVNTPGTVAIPPEQELTLVDAISRAGGFSRLANRSKVSLTRTSPDGKTQNHVVDADSLIAGSATNPWIVVNGDVIFVPERML